MFKTLKFVPGFIWAIIPSFLAWVFFCIPHWLKGTFESVKMRSDFSIIWDVANESKFFKEAMEGWYGFVIGCNIIIVDAPSEDNNYEQYLDHETCHVYQNYLFGILFYPVYILVTCYLWLFRKDKHAYLDNFFERLARDYAGQDVDIPKENWSDGPNDRWPWW